MGLSESFFRNSSANPLGLSQREGISGLSPGITLVWAPRDNGVWNIIKSDKNPAYMHERHILLTDAIIKPPN